MPDCKHASDAFGELKADIKEHSSQYYFSHAAQVSRIDSPSKTHMHASACADHSISAMWLGRQRLSVHPSLPFSICCPTGPNLIDYALIEDMLDLRCENVGSPQGKSLQC